MSFYFCTNVHSIIYPNFIPFVAYSNTSFLWPNNITLYGYTRFYLSIQLMNIWTTSKFWLLYIMLLWLYLYKFLNGYMFLTGKYSRRVELVDQILTLFVMFWVTASVFRFSYIILHLHQQCVMFSNFLAHQHLLLSFIFITYILMTIKWYCIVV